MGAMQREEPVDHGHGPTDHEQPDGKAQLAHIDRIAAQPFWARRGHEARDQQRNRAQDEQQAMCGCSSHLPLPRRTERHNELLTRSLRGGGPDHAGQKKHSR